MAPATLLLMQHTIELKAHKRNVKHLLLSQANPADLVHFTFTMAEAENLEWEHAKEFRFKGDMYDVVHQRKKGDSLILWCWWDSEETQLYQKFENLLAHNPFKPASKPSQQQLWQSFSHMLGGRAAPVAQSLWIASALTFTPYNFIVKSAVLNIAYPPPLLG